MKYRKKPVVIDAVLWCGIYPTGQWPDWFHRAVGSGKVLPKSDDSLSILTLEGEMRGEKGDWIIKGIKGEIYPCKPDIFEATYEPVKEKQS